MPLQINTVISRYNYAYLDELAEMVEKLNCVLWSVFFLVPTGRGKEADMISSAEHEKVFRWLYDLSKRVPFDIKTTAAQHYRRVVIQQKLREQKGMSDQEHIFYEDALTMGTLVKLMG